MEITGYRRQDKVHTIEFGAELMAGTCITTLRPAPSGGWRSFLEHLLAGSRERYAPIYIQ